MNSGRIVLWVGVVALIGGAVAFGLLTSDEPSPPKPAANGAFSAAPDAGGAPETAGPTPKTSPVARMGSSPFAPEPDLESAVATEGDGFLIEVRAQDEKPVAGAEVEVFQSDVNAQSMFFFGPQSEDQEPTLRVISDAHGHVRLKDATRALRAVGRARGMVGVLHYNPNPNDPPPASGPLKKVLELKPVRAVEVAVVDRADRPLAHAKVVIGSANPMGLAEAWTTEPEGLARFQLSVLEMSAYNQKQLVPHVQLPSGETVQGEAVDWNEAGVTKGRVKIDRGVTVRLGVQDEAGDPAPSEFSVHWKLVNAEPPKGDTSVFITELGLGVSGRMGPKRKFRGDRTVIAGFSPGARVEFRLEEKDHATVVKEMDLPAAESTVDVILARGALSPRVEVRIVTAQGVPIRDERFEIKIEQKPTSQEHEYFGGPVRRDAGSLPDDAGLLSVTAEPHVPGTLLVRRAHAMPGFQRAEWTVRLTFPALDPGAHFRVDDAKFEPLPVFVTGRVIDRDERPVAGAEVRLTCDPVTKRTWDPELFGALALRATSDETGEFCVRYAKPVKGLKVYAEHTKSRTRSAGLAFEAGNQGVVLKLEGTGALAGRFILKFGSSSEEAKGSGRLSVAIKGENLGGNAFESMWGDGRRIFTEENGEWNCFGLAAGLYDVKVILADNTVLEVKGVEVKPGEVHRDPRLDGVEVGGNLDDAVVMVKNREGEPLKGARVNFSARQENDGGRKHCQTSTDEQGRASVILPRGVRRTLTIHLDGYLAKHEKDATFPCTVVLERASKVTVVVTEPRPLPRKEEFTYGMRLAVPLDPKSIPASEGLQALEFNFSGLGSTYQRTLDESSQSVTIEGLAPGTYVATFYALPKLRPSGSDQGRHFRQLHTAGVTVGTVEIVSGGADRRVEFALTPTMLEQALQQATSSK